MPILPMGKSYHEWRPLLTAWPPASLSASGPRSRRSLRATIIIRLRLPPLIDHHALVGAAVLGLTPFDAWLAGRAVRAFLLRGTWDCSFHCEETPARGGSFHGPTDPMEHLRALMGWDIRLPHHGCTDDGNEPAIRTLVREGGLSISGTESVVVHRTGAVIERAAREPTALGALRGEEAECTRCPLYKFATQVVSGEGRASSRLMVVGEQPGDKEDLAGRPFVGPAGRLLDEALERAGIAREDVFVTNAVKHFKHEMRGKRRLHKRPNAYEIDRCKWWLERERAIVHPQAIIALGATAARSLFGRVITINKVRGQALVLADGTVAFVTIHPSALLRIQDSDERQQQFLAFVADLRKIARSMENKS